MVTASTSSSPVFVKTEAAEKLELIVQHGGEFVASYEFNSFEDMNSFIVEIAKKTSGRLVRLQVAVVSNES